MERLIDYHVQLPERIGLQEHGHANLTGRVLHILGRTVEKYVGVVEWMPSIPINWRIRQDCWKHLKLINMNFQAIPFQN